MNFTMKNKTKVVQVSNIAPQATKDQLSSLFSFIGKIDDIRLFPIIRDVAIPVQSRICFIKFNERDTVGVAQHLTNVVFIDRALLVIPYVPGEMPDEPKAIEVLNSCSNFPNVIHEVPWPSHVKTEIDGIILRTTDPELTKQKLPEYPNLPATTESFKVNEIRRTVILDNLAPETTAEQLEEFASAAGDVKFLRLGDVDPVTGKLNALVEYCSQTAVPPALGLQSLLLNGSQVNVNHSTVAVVKPVTKSNDAAVREIEEAMQRVKQAQSMLTAVDPMALIDSTALDTKASKSRSRSQSRRGSRSPSRRKSRSLSQSRSNRHRSRSDRRSRSRKRSRSRRRSRSRKKSRSRSHKRSRSRSPRSSKSSRKDKDRDKDKKRSSRDRDRKDKDKDKDKDKERDRSKDTKKDKSSSSSSSSSSKETKEKKSDVVEPQPQQQEGEPEVKEKSDEAAAEKVGEGEMQQQDGEGNPTQAGEGAEAGKEEVVAVQQEASKAPSEDKRSKKDKGKSPEKKSRDKERSHRRSRSGSPRRGSRRRSKSRSRSPGRRKKHRSRSRDRRKSRSPAIRSTKRSASPSHRRDRRSHSRDKKESGGGRDRRDKDRKEKEASRERDRKDKDRHRDRDKDRDRKDKKKDRKDKDEKRDKEKKDDKEKEEKKDSMVCRNYDEEELGYEKSDSAKKDARASPAVDMDISP